MRVLFDIVHPAHVHFFKYLYADLVAEGHETLVIAREKDVTLALLDEYGIPYTSVGRSGRKGRVGQAARADRARPHLVPGRAQVPSRPRADAQSRRRAGGARVARRDGRVRHRRRPGRRHSLPCRGAVRRRHHDARLHDRGLRRASIGATRATKRSRTFTRRGSRPIRRSAVCSVSATTRMRSCGSSRWSASHDRDESGMSLDAQAARDRTTRGRRAVCSSAARARCPTSSPSCASRFRHT